MAEKYLLDSNKTFPRYRTIGNAHRSNIRYQTVVR